MRSPRVSRQFDQKTGPGNLTRISVSRCSAEQSCRAELQQQRNSPDRSGPRVYYSVQKRFSSVLEEPRIKRGNRDRKKRTDRRCERFRNTYLLPVRWHSFSRVSHGRNNLHSASKLDDARVSIQCKMCMRYARSLVDARSTKKRLSSRVEIHFVLSI